MGASYELIKRGYKAKARNTSHATEHKTKQMKSQLTLIR